MTKAKILSVFLIFFLIISFVFSGNPSSSARSKVVDLLKMPIKFIYNIPKNIKYLNPLYYLKKKENDLKIQIIALNKKIIELNELSYQNRNLRALLNFKSNFAASSIASEIIAKDPSNWTSLIIIDKGYNEGIRRDMCVTSIYGLVGRVYDVSTHTSKVLLITDPDSRLGAFVERSREGGLLVGVNENLCRLIYLENDADVKKGDFVFTSGLTGIFPKGIFIGEVTNVGRDLNNLYKYADIAPYSRPSRIEEVLCIK